MIDVGSQVKYQAARISGPDRIYFDIEGAKISPELLHNQIDVEHEGFLKTVRIAQNQSGIVRVVLEVNRVKDYSVFLLPDPYRLVVDLYGTSTAAEEAAVASTPAPGPTTEIPSAKPESAKEVAASLLSKVAEVTGPKSAANSPGRSKLPGAEAVPATATSPGSFHPKTRQRRRTPPRIR